MLLCDSKPRRTKPKGQHPRNRLADGNGLYLYVQRTRTRSWIQRLVIRGRKHELGLGSVHLVSLAEAREQARAGGAPLADKRRTHGMPTFAEAAVTVIEQKKAGWRSARQANDWLNSLERYVFPRFGSRPVSPGQQRRRASRPDSNLARHGANCQGAPAADRRNAGVVVSP